MQLMKLILRANGIFPYVLEGRHRTSESLVYFGIENDKKNMKSDIRIVCGDIKKSVDLARIKYVL
jgi:hypothetical protein